MEREGEGWRLGEGRERERERWAETSALHIHDTFKGGTDDSTLGLIYLVVSEQMIKMLGTYHCENVGAWRKTYLRL